MNNKQSRGCFDLFILSYEVLVICFVPLPLKQQCSKYSYMVTDIKDFFLNYLRKYIEYLCMTFNFASPALLCYFHQIKSEIAHHYS